MVDDEDPVPSVLARSLEDEGYIVVQARNGREALEQLAQDRRIDLVLSDLVILRRFVGRSPRREGSVQVGTGRQRRTSSSSWYASNGLDRTPQGVAIPCSAS